MKNFVGKTLKQLQQRGMTRDEIISLGGTTSSGGNVTFAEGTPGFARVAELFAVKFEDVPRRKNKPCGSCKRSKPGTR